MFQSTPFSFAKVFAASQHIKQIVAALVSESPCIKIMYPVNTHFFTEIYYPKCAMKFSVFGVATLQPEFLLLLRLTLSHKVPPSATLRIVH
jgi:hypothetical protein